MHIGVMEVVLHIPHATSLKDKRQVVRRIKDRTRNRFNVSMAETGGQNTWQSCELAFSMVATTKVAIEREFSKLLAKIESEPEISMTEHWIDFY